jgi:hypothetical protein
MMSDDAMQPTTTTRLTSTFIESVAIDCHLVLILITTDLIADPELFELVIFFKE